MTYNVFGETLNLTHPVNYCEDYEASTQQTVLCLVLVKPANMASVESYDPAPTVITTIVVISSLCVYLYCVYCVMDVDVFHFQPAAAADWSFLELNSQIETVHSLVHSYKLILHFDLIGYYGF